MGRMYPIQSSGRFQSIIHGRYKQSLNPVLVVSSSFFLFSKIHIGEQINIQEMQQMSKESQIHGSNKEAPYVLLGGDGGVVLLLLLLLSLLYGEVRGLCDKEGNICRRTAKEKETSSKGNGQKRKSRRLKSMRKN